MEEKEENMNNDPHLQRPQFSQLEAEEIALDYYGIKSVKTKEYASYEDQNFYFETIQCSKYLLKMYNTRKSLQEIHFMSDVMDVLNENRFTTQCVILTKDGEKFITKEDSRQRNKTFFIMMLRWVEGDVMRDIPSKKWNINMLEILGKTIGTFDKILMESSLIIEDREDIWDLDCCYKTILDHIKYVNDKHQKELIEYFVNYYKQNVYDLVVNGHLRKSIIHMDINEMNTILNGDGTSMQDFGVIDFELLLNSTLVNEIAISVAYLLQLPAAHEGPLSLMNTAIALIKGYNNVIELTEKEFDVILPLATMRICVSQVMSTYNQMLEPDNKYISICQAGFWKLLEMFRKIDFNDAAQLIKNQCGFRCV